MIRIEHAYLLLGAVLATFALLGWRDRDRPRRLASALFWALLAFAFLCGDLVPPAFVGALVIVLALIAGFGGLDVATNAAGGDHDAATRTARAAALGNRLFLPVLLIPLVTLAGVAGLARVQIAGRALFAAANGPLVSLAIACIIALAVAMRLTRSTLPVALGEGRRLLDAIGWSALLPLLLAMLGGVFDRAGVGSAVAHLVTTWLPVGHRFVAVLAYAGGMALFTMIMGNAFAAFPVMMGGLGLPILVGVHHADPAPLCALGMLSGYCGTLMTPMAANYNLVPAALLELRDPYGVIRAQAPTGAAIFLVNLLLMNLLLFR